LVVIAVKKLIETGAHRLRMRLVVQRDILILDRPPEAFDNDVVKHPAAAIRLGHFGRRDVVAVVVLALHYPALTSTLSAQIDATVTCPTLAIHIGPPEIAKTVLRI